VKRFIRYYSILASNDGNSKDTTGQSAVGLQTHRHTFPHNYMLPHSPAVLFRLHFCDEWTVNETSTGSVPRRAVHLQPVACDGGEEESEADI
jgi:hypothetical protein